jgi:regulator of replication initiation timing
MVKRNEIMNPDEYLDLDELDSKKRSTAKKEKLFLTGRDEINDFIERKLIPQGKEHTTINIPTAVYRALKPSDSTWKALQEWLLKRMSDLIISRALDEIYEYIENESPEAIEYDERDGETMYRIEHGEIPPIQTKGELGDYYELNKASFRLRELYTAIHDHVVMEAYKSHANAQMKPFYEKYENITREARVLKEENAGLILDIEKLKLNLKESIREKNEQIEETSRQTAINKELQEKIESQKKEIQAIKNTFTRKQKKLFPK